MKKILIVVGIFMLLLVTFATLTRAGYIENYLGIDFLCPEEVNEEDSCEGLDEPFRGFCEQNQSYDCQVTGNCVDKPVIYLYPEQEQKIQVKLDFNGELIADYPDFNYELGGWEVTAYPDGKIINLADNREYSYLFWEGIPSEKEEYDLSRGFVVRGEDTEVFLQKKLSEIGLVPKEYNEFIVYWYPEMKNNKYNLIHFAQGHEYIKHAELKINPNPDSILRVFMVYKSLEHEVAVEPQIFDKFERVGFSVVEWGGSELK
jgi:hypothetical protein